MIVDLFAGGGGASTGIRLATGRDPDVAVNHSAAAIAMHTANHPRTKHLCASVWDVSPREVCGRRKVELLWASPDCTHFSRAKGGKPRETGRRALAHVVIEWARAVRPEVILLENVEEFAGWGPLLDDGRPCPERKGSSFAAWVAQLHWLGYVVEWRSLVAADYGTPTTRKRLFLVARRDRRPIEWPALTHGPGRSRPWRSAAEVIDWSLPVPSIFGRARPLAEKTLARIARGIERFVEGAAEPFVVEYYGTATARGVDSPLGTATTRDRFALVSPHLVLFRGTDAAHVDASARSLDDPLSTISAGGIHHALVAPYLVQTGYGERVGQDPRVLDLAAPLTTVVAGGIKHGLACAYLCRHFGGPRGAYGRDLAEPVPTVTAVDHHALVTATLSQDRRTEVAQLLGHEPRVTIRGVDYTIADIGMRMLTPAELFRAQGFPADYDLLEGRISKTEQVRLAGNSVCPPVAEALVRSQLGLAAVAA